MDKNKNIDIDTKDNIVFVSESSSSDEDIQVDIDKNVNNEDIKSISTNDETNLINNNKIISSQDQDDKYNISTDNHTTIDNKNISIENTKNSKDIDNDKDVEPKYNFLVLSGGSVYAISQIGAVKKLIEEKLIDLKKLKAVAGTSAGSLFGVLIVLGFTIDEIWDFVYHLDMKNMVKPDFFMLLQKCGVESGQIIHNLFEEILTKKTGIKHINFRQLYELTKIHFIIVGSCLTTKEIVYYDYINTPTFKVSMAIRISISIPGFFTPVTIGNNKYVDGGILNDYPMNLFADKLDKTIGILVCNEFKTDYKYPEEYFMAIINLFLYHYYQKTADQWHENTIYIKKKIDNVSLFNFDVNNKTKEDLYASGVEASEEFIENLHKKNIDYQISNQV